MPTDGLSIFVLGIPSNLGGMNSEMGHTILLWRAAGIDVTCLWMSKCRCHNPTVTPDDNNPWLKRLEAAGVKLVETETGRFNRVSGLRNAILWGPGGQHTCHNWRELKAMGVKLIWSPGMCFTMPYEVEAFSKSPPAALHCQSNFQKLALEAAFVGWKTPQISVIPGAFDASEFPFRPSYRRENEPFVVCRIARSHRSKWHPKLWSIENGLILHGIDLKFIAEAWTYDLSMHCGQPPYWAETLPSDAETTASIMARSHAMICPNQDWLTENWPRVGLEALSAGVPLLVDDRGGWKDLCGSAAIYCKTIEDFSDGLLRLAQDESYRQHLITLGRMRLNDVNNSQRIVDQWQELFASVKDAA